MIPIQNKKIWSWIGIIFDWMILLRIFVFRDHLKGNIWDSQQRIIVYEVPWLNFDNVSLYHVHYVHYVPCYLWRKSRSTRSIRTLWAWTRFKKQKILFRIVTEVLGHYRIFNYVCYTVIWVENIFFVHDRTRPLLKLFERCYIFFAPFSTIMHFLVKKKNTDGFAKNICK